MFEPKAMPATPMSKEEMELQCQVVSAAAPALDHFTEDELEAGNHVLEVVSYHDGIAECSCGKWRFIRTGAITRAEAEREHHFHRYGKYPIKPNIYEALNAIAEMRVDASTDFRQLTALCIGIAKASLGQHRQGDDCCPCCAERRDLLKVAEAVLDWARTPGDHGGNPYTKEFVMLANEAVLRITG